VSTRCESSPRSVAALFILVVGLLSALRMAVIAADEKPSAEVATSSAAAGMVNADVTNVDSGKTAAPKPLVAITKNTPSSVADLLSIQAGIQQAVAKGLPATVGITIGGAFGSGVIVTEDGYILTAGHVAGRPGREASITMPDGSHLHAKTLGVNHDMDSGMLKIVEAGKYPHVELGKSGDLKLGQWCVTLGHPGGYVKDRPPVVRAGRVLYNRDDAVGTDCTIVGGDSGGPLLDISGRVIGIHSRISDGVTDNYHVPIDTYRDTWDRLAKGDDWGGPPQSGGPLLGINGETVNRDGKNSGCKITGIFSNTPAEKAQLQRDDIIVSFDGKTVVSLEGLQTAIAKHKAGDEVTVIVERGEDRKEIKVKLGQRE
jgi:serine protease Do